METNEVIQAIKDKYPDAEVMVAGEDCAFQATVVSDSFADLNKVKRQQAILGLFRAQLQEGSLHALSLKIFTLEEWKQQQAKDNKPPSEELFTIS